MTIREMIATLEAERRRLDAALESLRKIGETALEAAPRKRGRKFMGKAERAEVSDRMRKYWAGRRKAKGAA